MMHRLGLPTVPRAGVGLVWGAIAALFALQSASAQPLLQIQRTEGNSLDLLWPTNSPGFLLERSATPDTAVGWTVVPGEPALRADRWVQTVSASESALFYRLRFGGPILPGIVETSPAAGETGVSVTRETVFRLAAPLAGDAVLDAERLFAGFGGRRLLSRVEVAADRRSVTLFYLENLPAAARVSVVFDASGLKSASGQDFDGDGDGLAGGIRVLEFTTGSSTAVPGTAVEGRVFASEPGAGQVNRPLAGVIVTVDGSEESLRAVTDATGFFRLDPAPAGRFFVHVDGRLAEGSSWPGGAYYPFVGKAWEAVPGKRDNLAGGTGEIFLPLVPADALQTISANSETRVGFPPGVIATNPVMAGVEVRVPANALFSEDGRRGGRVGIAAVAPDRLPEPLPPGLNLPLVITIQTDGPQNFDRPVPVRFPNLPDPVTGRRTPPGAKTILWSFNHDTGRWEPQGTATITADGLYAETDPGVGVRQPGWHGVAEGTPAEGPVPEVPEVPELPSEPEEPVEEDRCAGQYGYFDCDGDGCPESTEPCEDECKKFKDKAEQTEPYCPLTRAINNVVSYTYCALPVISWATACPDDAWLSKFMECREQLANAKADFGICNSKRGGSSVVEVRRRMARLADAASSLAEQEALSAAGARPYELLFGSPAWFAVEIEDQQLLADFFAAWGAAMSDASPGGKQVTLDEFSDLLGLPLPGALDAGHVQTAVDRVNAWHAGLLPAAERTAIESAVQSRETLWASYRARGWTSTYDGLLEFERLSTEPQSLSARSSFFPRRRYWYAIENPLTGQVFRGRLDARGRFSQVVLPANTYLKVTYVDPVTLAVGEGVFKSGPAGTTTSIPAVVMLASTTFPDGDGDGLADVVEGVVATRADLPDSDNDGVNDAAELRAGLNPLDGQVTAQGIVAAVRTQGTPRDIAMVGNIAVVADGASGVTLVDMIDPLQPVVLGRVVLGGTALAVAADGNRVGVALGTGGCAVIDISDPVRPRVLWEQRHSGVAGGVSVQFLAVAMRGDLMLVGTSSAELLVIEAASGLMRQRLTLPFGGSNVRTAQILVVDDIVYVVNDQPSDLLNASHLVTFAIDGTVVMPLGVATVQRGSPSTGIGRRFWVGGGYAYLGYFGGYYVYDVRDPAQPVLVGRPASNGQAVLAPLLDGARQVVALTTTGAGLTADLSIYDVSNPTNTTSFLRSFPVGRLAWAARMHKGFVLVGDNSGRLMTMNVLAPDLGSSAPTLAPRVIRLADAANGGRRYLADPGAFDDVVVRDVEVLVDGRRAGLSGGYPFQVPFSVPASGPLPTVVLRATDRAGNVTNREISLADITAPGLTRLSPAPGATWSTELPVKVDVSFNEVLRADSITPGIISIVAAGSDGQFGTDDDEPVGTFPPVISADGRTVAVTTVSNLPVRAHQITLAAGLADLAGNSRPRSARWTFQMGPSVPRLTLESPENRWVEIGGQLPPFRMRFDKVMPAEELEKLTVQLVRAGADGVLGTGDDLPVTPIGISYDPLSLAFVVTPPAGLPGGRYRIQVSSPMYGLNPFRRDVEFATQGNTWVAAGGGLWSDAANWSRGAIWANDALTIPAGIPGTTNSSAVSIASMRTESRWQSAANLTLTGTASALGPVRWTEGNWTGGGMLTLSGGMDIASTQFANTSAGLNNFTVVSRSLVRFQSGLVRVMSSLARWENRSGSTLEVGSGALRFSADGGSGVRGRFDNLGLIRKAAGAGSFGFDGFGVFNDGRVEVAAGELSFPAYDGAGSVDVSAGAKAVFSLTSRLRNGSTVTGAGAVDFGAQTSTTIFRADAEVDGAFSPTGLVRLVDGRLVFQRGVDIPTGVFETRAGALGGLEFRAPVRLANLTVNGAGGVRFDTSATLDRFELLSGPLLGAGIVRAGTVEWDNGEMNNGGTVEISGSLRLQPSTSARVSNGTLRILPGAKMEVESQAGFGNSAGAGLIDLQGSLGLLSGQSLSFPGRIDNRGQIELTGAQLDLNPGNGTVASGRYRAMPGGLLRLRGGDLRAGTNSTFLDGGEIAGAGRIIRSGRGPGLARLDGRVRLDDASGALAWVDYGVRFGAAAETVVRIGAAGAGRMTVAGSGTQLVVDGKLRIELEPGFVPGVGTTYTLFTAPAVSGNFSQVEGAVLPGGTRVQVNVSAGQVQLVVVPQ